MKDRAGNGPGNPKALPRPRVLVSRCIEFDSCRWNGLMIASPEVKRLREYADLVPVCPEAETGLGVPREPVRLVETGEDLRLVQHGTGRDVTGDMRAFAASFLGGIDEIDGLILKDRSPSCGLRDVKVYPGMEKSPALPRKAAGIFAAEALSRFPDLPAESEGRLTNQSLREHFYRAIFTLASFRQARAGGTVEALSRFHAANKHLLMALNQSAMRDMGRIAANREGAPIADIFTRYGERLRGALSRPARTGSVVNALMHALGYFSEKLSQAEKRHFLSLLERYREGKTPLGACTAVLSSWIARFGDPYLEGQTLYEPLPEGLADLSDSGKGRGAE